MQISSTTAAKLVEMSSLSVLYGVRARYVVGLATGTLLFNKKKETAYHLKHSLSALEPGDCCAQLKLAAYLLAKSVKLLVFHSASGGINCSLPWEHRKKPFQPYKLVNFSA